VRFGFDRLHRFVVSVFEAVDVLPEHADTTARRLLEADLRGRTGHGIIRVPQYVARIQGGAINLRPTIEVSRSTPVSALVDGDNGLGQVVMTLAAETAIAKAEQIGMAWVGTVRSNHAGAAGIYTGMALDRRSQRQCDAPMGRHRAVARNQPHLDRHPGPVGAGVPARHRNHRGIARDDQGPRPGW
jgi:LDH2 family malate/lactate/ureidoglycolate dehydrogenase